jgi:hypothetical protein
MCLQAVTSGFPVANRGSDLRRSSVLGLLAGLRSKDHLNTVKANLSHHPSDARDSSIDAKNAFVIRFPGRHGRLRQNGARREAGRHSEKGEETK